MNVSTQGLIALIGHEGIVLSRYRDSVGVWTIGVGHTSAAGGIDPRTFTGQLTMRQALALLRTDIAKYEADVRRAVTVALEQHEFDALVSFHYNTGAVARAELTASLNAGNRSKAGRQFLNYMKPPEIGNRRRAESTLFLTGQYPDAAVTVYPATRDGKVLWSQGKALDATELLQGVTQAGGQRFSSVFGTIAHRVFTVLKGLKP